MQNHSALNSEISHYTPSSAQLLQKHTHTPESCATSHLFFREFESFLAVARELCSERRPHKSHSRLLGGDKKKNKTKEEKEKPLQRAESAPLASDSVVPRLDGETIPGFSTTPAGQTIGNFLWKLKSPLHPKAPRWHWQH